MRPHHLITAGLSLALLVGATAGPALASHGPRPRISGEGRTANSARFSIHVRQDKPANGHLRYTSADGRFKVRCNGFDTYSPRMYVQPGAPAATVTADHCVVDGPRRPRTRISVEAEFVDHSSFTRGAKDEVNIRFTRPAGDEVTDNGRVRSGDVTVR